MSPGPSLSQHPCAPPPLLPPVSSPPPSLSRTTPVAPSTPPTHTLPSGHSLPNPGLSRVASHFLLRCVDDVHSWHAAWWSLPPCERDCCRVQSAVEAVDKGRLRRIGQYVSKKNGWCTWWGSSLICASSETELHVKKNEWRGKFTDLCWVLSILSPNWMITIWNQMGGLRRLSWWNVSHGSDYNRWCNWWCRGRCPTLFNSRSLPLFGQVELRQNS